jgi:hypothetical protein
MENLSPVLLVFCTDLLAYSRIEGAARQVGFEIQMMDLRLVEPLDLDFSSAIPRQTAEHLVGPGARLIEHVTELRPALILIDLGDSQIPWQHWLPVIKSSPATRRIPVVCFGAHTDVEMLKQAQRLGADAVLDRSAFFSKMLDVIQDYAKVTDYPMLKITCQAPLSMTAIHGLELFNQGKFFEAHEVLESAWNEDQTPGRELYRAILQVAVAYLQIERRNYNGAVKMFLRLRQWIEPLPAVCRGVDVAQLRTEARLVYQNLLALGPQQINSFDHSLFKPVRYRQGGQGD